MQNKPMVSIIIPTYNRADKIKRPLQSILGQTYKNWEIIIVDDASSDNTEAIIRQEKITNLIYLKNCENLGPSFSRNVGIKHAKGDYIAFLDSDDFWHSYHLEQSLEILKETGYKICSALWDENYNGVQTFVGDMEWFKEKLLDLQRELNVKIDNKIWKLDHDFYEFTLKTDFYCFQINTVVLEKEILQNVGLFNENLKVSEDLEFLYRIFSKYSLVIINCSHFVYHFGNDNLWAFVDRERNFEDFSLEKKERLYKYLENKIKFYQLLDEKLENSYEISRFKDPDAIFNTINYCIVRRCLTIMLLKGKKAEQFNNYYSLAKKYARNSHLQFLLENYNVGEVVPQYFYLY